MRAVRKLAMTGASPQDISIPQNSRVLFVGVEGTTVYLFFDTDPGDNNLEVRRFYAVATATSLPQNDNIMYRGSFLSPTSGVFMHVFENSAKP